MRRLILPLSLLFILTWQLAHHKFMWGGYYVIHQWVGFMGFVISPLLITGAILVAAHALGRLLTRDWMVAICLGLGGLAAVTWLLALSQLLYTPILVFIVLLIAVYGGIKHMPKSVVLVPRITEWAVEDKLLLFVIAWWIYRTALLSFNPSTGFDATHAHIWQVQNFLREGGYIFHPHHTNIALVHSLTMLQKLCGIQDPGSSMQYVAAMMSAGFLYRLGMRYHGRTAGLLATLIFLITPAVYLVYSQWFAGIFVVMYMLAALWEVAGRHWVMEWGWEAYRTGKLGVWSLVNSDKANRLIWVVVGLLLGFGCASKITMLPFAVLIIALCGRNWWRVFLWMCLAAAPWYLVNAYQYGNPFFPFKDEWFGWLSFGTQEAVATIYARPSLPVGWCQWQVVNFWHTNMPLSQPGQMSPAGPLLAALSLPLFFVKWTKPAIVLGIMVALMYAYWWGIEGVWHDRYMVPTFTLHALLCAWGVAELCRNR